MTLPLHRTQPTARLVSLLLATAFVVTQGCATVVVPPWQDRPLPPGHVVGIGNDADPAKARSKAYKNAFFRLPPAIKRSIVYGTGGDVMLSEVQSVANGSTVHVLYKVSRLTESTS